MILDRQLQLELLNKMSTTYPEYYDFRDEYEYGTDAYNKVVANLTYLIQHDLIEERSLLFSRSMSGKKQPQIHLPTINHNGMDFLADDGGLSAILGMVTIKFEANQLKAILEAKIMASDLSPERKQSMIDVLRELPAESIKHLTTKIVDTGYDNLESLMNLIQSTLF
ncbi:hypothetical protein [Acinetobacter calcoaceticus]|uniref:hypothetical protein n=1 Tax=Acinetobacter calcoaceticus TaxID=471 RepID=UPI000FB4BE3D